MIIEIVGIDGAGKSTIAEWVARRWDFDLRKVRPFDQAFWHDAALIERTLGTRAVESIKAGAIARALLLEMSRLNENRIVFDRFVEGAQMYWAVKHIQPLPQEILRELRVPDQVILLDVNPELAIERRGYPSEKTREDELFYLRECASYFKTKAVEKAWKVINTNLPLEIVEEEIQKLMISLGLSSEGTCK
jgi:thymidylate kinase